MALKSLHRLRSFACSSILCLVPLLTMSLALGGCHTLRGNPPSSESDLEGKGATLRATKKLSKGLFAASKYGWPATRYLLNEWQTNIAMGRPASQSTTTAGFKANLAVDGNRLGVLAKGSVTGTHREPAPWWEVDLGAEEPITAVTVWNRTDCCSDRLVGASVQLLNGNQQVIATQSLPKTDPMFPVQGLIFREARARYVRVLGAKNQPLSLAEVEVWKKSLAPGEGVCWKQTQGRGVGKPLSECEDGEKDGALCYPVCTDGYDGNGPVCWARCPAGYNDDGVTCRIDAKIISADNSGCPGHDKCGLTLAKGCSNCPEGFKNDGCTCRRDVQIIGKQTYGRTAGKALTCPRDLEYGAGLCYSHCPQGMYGNGPVCWGHCPKDYPVECGAACATSQPACAEAVGDMVTAPINAVANIAGMVGSFGSSAAVNTGARVAAAGAKAATQSALKAQFKNLAKYTSESVLESTALGMANAAVNGGTFDWATLDPTGLATVVMTFNQPLCGGD